MRKPEYDVLKFISVLKSIATDKKVSGRVRLAAADRIAQLAQFYSTSLENQESKTAVTDDLLDAYKQKHGGKHAG